MLDNYAGLGQLTLRPLEQRNRQPIHRDHQDGTAVTRLSIKNTCSELWDSTLNTKKRLFNGDLASDLTHDAYCEYYQHQWHLVAGNCDGRYVAIKTVELMNEHTKYLIRTPNFTRQDILASWKSKSTSTGNATPSNEAWNNSIDLAARLLLMLKFGVVKHQKVPRHCLSWTSGSLRDFVHNHFNTSPALHDDHIRLPKTFDAWAIFAIAGIEIDSKLLIFHHASFLECQADESQ